MKMDKRFFLAFALAMAAFFGTNEICSRLGLLPKPAPPRPKVAQKSEAGPTTAPTGDARSDAPGNAAAKADPTPPTPATTRVEVATGPAGGVVEESELVLGSTDRSKGYGLRVELTQKGAAVARVALANFFGENLPGQPRNRPLNLIAPDPSAPPSFSMAISRVRSNATADPSPGDDEAAATISQAFLPLDSVTWELVRGEGGKVVRTVADKAGGEAQEVHFRTKIAGPDPLTVTRVYRLRKGLDRNGFEMEIGFASPRPQSVAYQVGGPHNLPIEGIWYTGTFREVFFGQVTRNATQVDTKTADVIVKARANPERFSSLPLRYAGVENQHFAVFLEPDPTPRDDRDRREADAYATVVHQAAEPQKSDVSVMLTSRPLEVGPGAPVTHAYKVFAGPKSAAALEPYGAADLASYRKSSWFFIPGANYMAQFVIAPMLDKTYALTAEVSRWFGGNRGSYGVSIILLTMFVRLCLFPLGRKMAISAKKMQDLAPLLKEVQEKHKDDKERVTKETFALYRKHGVNPVGGCLPAIIQMPILVGLWQALNNSVSLRHAPFLWIDDLSAPDKLFHMPFEVPWIGEWFNLLPLVVVGLMLLQTKLFSPPATTPEAEMQQKMMKYMMIFMAVMFYKVPSGLGFYFITSSLWQIGERLILPKTSALKVSLSKPDAGDGPPPGRPEPPRPGGPGRGGRDRSAPADPVGGSKGWLDDIRDRVNRLMDEAQHERTTRNVPGRDADRDRNRPRPKPGKRR